jgi:hypothetical protein
MGRKYISIHGKAADGGTEVDTMKYKKKYIIVVSVTVISLLLIGSVFIFGTIINIDSARTGVARSYLRTIGKAIACNLKENNTFPMNSAGGVNYMEGQSNQWYSFFDVEKLLSESARPIDEDIPKAYFDADIWTVIKNMPDDPPPNLIVLATRNVDPSSLRTKITDTDMEKCIRFNEQKDDLWILNKAAVLIRADGLAISAPVTTSTSKRKYTGKYKYIYADQPFDVTTNLVNGLQVKYLTPEGEIIPAND